MFKRGDKVLKILYKNLGRKGGKKEAKFSGPYIITDISDLGVATLRTVKGCVMKRGVPVKQLQKYNDADKKYEGPSTIKRDGITRYSPFYSQPDSTTLSNLNVNKGEVKSSTASNYAIFK